MTRTRSDVCYRLIATLINARLNCIARNNPEWKDKHEDGLQALARNILPSGSGIDSGTKIDLDKSTTSKIVLTFGFHHMNDGGYYVGWTDHTAVITPSLTSNFDIRITGRDRNQIKDYLRDTFDYVLSRTIVQTFDPETDTTTFAFEKDN